MGQPCGFWLGLPLCVSAVLERVHGARFVVLRPPFAWQQQCQAQAELVSLMPLAPPNLHREISRPECLWITALSAQLVRSQCSTTSVTQRID